MPGKEKRYLICVTILGALLLGLCILDLCADFVIPGLNPLLSSAFWFCLWQLFKIRGTFPGGIWTFMYLLIIVMNIIAGASQIITAIR